jgi:hypothetical protein
MSHLHQQVLGTADVDKVEAPFKKRSYLICAFASFGGLLHGYDVGHIGGVLGMVVHPYSPKLSDFFN